MCFGITKQFSGKVFLHIKLWKVTATRGSKQKQKVLNLLISDEFHLLNFKILILQ